MTTTFSRYVTFEGQRGNSKKTQAKSLRNYNKLSPVTRIIVDYDLREDYSPEIIIRNLKTLLDSRLGLRVGDPIDFFLLKQKYCVGFHVRDEYHEYLPCPYRREIKKGFQCFACSRRDILNPCIICNGTECPKIRHATTKCGTSVTSVYIVTFGSQPKIGVSIRERLHKRWLEQGADWGIEIGFTPNGSIARLVEDDISHSMGIPKSIKLAVKLDSIYRNEAKLPELLKLSRHYFEMMNRKYPELQEGELEPIQLEKEYNMKVNRIPFSFDVSGRTHIKGEFLGMKGPLFFFQDNFPHVVDFRLLRGRVLGEESIQNQLGLAPFV